MGFALYYSPVEEVPQQLSPLACFPEGGKLLIGHGWPEWRPKGDMTCLPCLRTCRIDELCRSSTAYSIQPHIPSTVTLENVELLQSSYTYGTMVRQGSRFAPTLPYQAFNPFGVGELWETSGEFCRDGWHGENGIWNAEGCRPEEK